ncbi:MAG: WhiB family transcriptional regulator [Acidimicrobiaceae bacterium]|nr:WhiB family transcriptional regulator [Acidimicrobiaceae bacterium]
MFATESYQELQEIVSQQRDWDDARCRDTAGPGSSLWFSEQIPDIAAAKAICRTCSLMVECLDGAITRHEPWGVWGGQLFANGKILAQKRKRGRPPKNRPIDDDGIALTA